MLKRLHRIVREVNAAPGLRQALEIVVDRVSDAMAVDVCSVYLIDPESDELVLMETRGLHRESIGQVRLQRAEGLVGLVAEREEPINLDKATEHPRFRYFPETGEERFSSFLGVPVIHYRRLLGVLVVQQRAERRFDDEEEAFLVTLAAQLAGAIAHAEASGAIEGLRELGGHTERRLVGLPGAPGVAIGTAVVQHDQVSLESVPDRPVEDPAAEEAALRSAVGGVRDDLEKLSEQLAGSVSADERMLFDVYLRMLDGDSLVSETLERIRHGSSAAAALRDTVAEHVRVFEDMENDYLSERASDIRDLGRRILLRLREDTSQARPIPEQAILVGYEVSASQLAEAAGENLVGVVSASGSRNSHTAILARALGLPAVMGASDLSIGRLDGKRMVVDGYAGRIYIEPSEPVEQEYRRLMEEEREFAEGLESLRGEPAITPDGHRIGLYANTGLISDINLTLDAGCDGIGLHRTEFPFIIRERFPGETEQAGIYRRVLENLTPRRVVLRTLDVGGDKSLPYFPVREDNPFLGWRGIRLTLDHPEIFLTQLRAMMRADVGLGNLRVMFPMVSRVRELDDAVGLMRRACEELREDGIDARLPPVGVMVEVPAAAYQAAALARRVDFLSVGTNDLTQYLLAVDRNNARVADLYDELHPAVLQAIVHIVEAGRSEGREVTVCGGMAGDPAGALLLLGSGIDGVSMSVANLLRIKWVIRSVPMERARALFAEALGLESPEEVRRLAIEVLEEYGLAGLTRAGK